MDNLVKYFARPVCPLTGHKNIMAEATLTAENEFGRLQNVDYKYERCKNCGFVDTSSWITYYISAIEAAGLVQRKYQVGGGGGRTTDMEELEAELIRLEKRLNYLQNPGPEKYRTALNKQKKKPRLQLVKNGNIGEKE